MNEEITASKKIISCNQSIDFRNLYKNIQIKNKWGGGKN